MPASERTVRELRNFGRGVIGALLFGTPFLMTMETWWAGKVLPLPFLLLYAFLGLGVVLAVDVVVGFREEEKDRRPSALHIATGFAGLVFQSAAAAYAVLFAFGTLGIDGSPLDAARMGLVQLVPMGLGAAIANRMLREGDAQGRPSRFPQEVAAFVLGALLFIFPIAPTEEVRLIATRAGWSRILLLAGLTLAVAYLALFLLEFRGQQHRRSSHGSALRVADVCAAFMVAAAISFAILLVFGHFVGSPPQVWLQLTIVLAFPATLGGSAARVIL